MLYQLNLIVFDLKHYLVSPILYHLMRIFEIAKLVLSLIFIPHDKLTI